MQVIIAEKAIAGKRVAELLADSGKVLTKGSNSLPVFEFRYQNEPAIVVPLKGHVMEVIFPKEYSNWHATDLKTLAKASLIYEPTYGGLVSTLKETIKSATSVVVATDADREGESIGVEALNMAGVKRNDNRVKRAYFSAITKKDLETAWKELTPLDYRLADSADARREIDLLWGASLTRYISLSSKRTGKDFLSVGRVQTPTLRLVVDRQKEINAFKPEKFWEVLGTFEKNGEIFEASHQKQPFKTAEEAKAIVAKKPEKAQVKNVKAVEKIVKRPIPFNTTEFLRSATNIGFSAGAAMSVAESLYMAGFISYPRTDSSAYPVNLDLKEILVALQKGPFEKEASKILQKPLNPSVGKETKDHPPIHPVAVAQKNQLDPKQWKIYELVVRRFLATLSEDAKVLATTVLLDVSGETFVANGQIILHKGWKEVYHYSQLNETVLPKLEEGEWVKVVDVKELEKQTQPPARYSQGALIKLMEQLGLGTKATRAEIIQKLLNRGYLVGSKMLEANPIGFTVIDTLTQYCPIVTEAKMTADTEKEMDDIASGSRTKETVVNHSREQLVNVLDTLLTNKDEIGVKLRQTVLAAEDYGLCGKCNVGHFRLLKGKTGKRFVGCSNYPTCSNTYPLPQKGRLQPLGTKCSVCNAPMVRVIAMKRKSEYCLNFSCSTKSDWGKKEPTNTSVKPVKKEIKKKELNENSSGKTK